MSKTERLELRVSADDKSAIATAAALEHRSTTEFVRGAVLDRVEYLRAQAHRTLMPAGQFDQMMRSLDEPERTPRLQRAFNRDRPFDQR